MSFSAQTADSDERNLLCMGSVAFDVDIIPDNEAVAVVFYVSPSTDWRAVRRLVASLVYAYAAAEYKTLAEMESELATMMTITTGGSGTKVELRRPSSDPSYFSRFDAALCEQALRVH